MTTVYVVVEGETEEAFLNQLVVPHLAARGVWLHPMRVLRGGGARGGGSRWQPWRDHITRLLHQRRGRDVRVSTMLDLYQIPRDVPGWTAPGTGASEARADTLIEAMRQALDDDRFQPYISVHEFEALLYADLDAVEAAALGLTNPAAWAELRRAVADLAPEAVDDGPETAPSKRLLRAIPSWRKRVQGPSIAAAIGLPRLRERCPRFGRWLEWLEAPGHDDPAGTAPPKGDTIQIAGRRVPR